jgi:hypothetical protein
MLPHFNHIVERLRVLESLGAILFVPVGPSKEQFSYKVMRQLLKKPPELLDEEFNPEKLGLIAHESDLRAVEQLQQYLGIQMPPPNQVTYVAAFPRTLEEDLARQELTAFRNLTGKKDATEEDVAKVIQKTYFNVIGPPGGPYKVVLDKMVPFPKQP